MGHGVKLVKYAMSVSTVKTVKNIKSTKVLWVIMGHGIFLFL